MKRGNYYRGTVTSVREFGVFVKVNEVVEGLVGRGELFDRGGQKPRNDEAFQPGDEIVVRAIRVDDRGRVELSRRAAIDVDEALIEY